MWELTDDENACRKKTFSCDTRVPFHPLIVTEHSRLTLPCITVNNGHPDNRSGE